jgi:hypothetical protein
MRNYNLGFQRLPSPLPLLGIILAPILPDRIPHIEKHVGLVGSSATLDALSLKQRQSGHSRAAVWRFSAWASQPALAPLELALA